MTMVTKFLILLGLCALQVSAQYEYPGPCPTTVSFMQNFELDRFLGKWYEYQRYYSNAQANGSCTTADYTMNPNGTVALRDVQTHLYTGEVYIKEGYGTVDTDSGDGIMVVTHQDEIVGEHSKPLWILGTDYDGFLVTYNCMEYGDINKQIVWMLTRQRFPPAQVLADAQAVINANSLEGAFLVTPQENCSD